MPSKKQIFRRHSKKEIVDIIRKNNFNVSFTSRTTKSKLVDDLFKLKDFKELLKSLPSKSPRKLSPAQQSNADRLRKLKKSNVGKTEEEKIHIIEDKPVEVSKIEKDFKFEKEIKGQVQHTADLKTMEDKTVKDGVSKQFHRQHNKQLRDFSNEDAGRRDGDRKLRFLTETKTTDAFDRRIAGAVSAKVNREFLVIENKLGVKKGNVEPFLNELDRLHQEDPNNPLFTLMKLLKERDKERKEEELSIAKDTGKIFDKGETPLREAEDLITPPKKKRKRRTKAQMKRDKEASVIAARIEKEVEEGDSAIIDIPESQTGTGDISQRAGKTAPGGGIPSSDPGTSAPSDGGFGGRDPQSSVPTKRRIPQRGPRNDRGGIPF